jgi:hypothetical protein
MLAMIIFILFTNAHAAQVVSKLNFTEFSKFNRTVPSMRRIPKCEYNKGYETGIFSITYKKSNKNNLFLITKGLILKHVNGM